MEQEKSPALPFIKPRKRTSPKQRLHLVEILQANLDIARATVKGFTKINEYTVFWNKLSGELNNMNRKCARTVSGWQQVWKIWYRKLRSKSRRISASLQEINMDKDGTVSVKEGMNEVEMKILDIITKIEDQDQQCLNLIEAGTSEEKQKVHSTSRSSPSADNDLLSHQINGKQEEMLSSAKSRKRPSTETSITSQSLKVECRVCLKYVYCEDQCCDIFGPWNQNPEATIASYFTQVTNIQVSPSDRHTKYICFKCLSQLQSCTLFIEKAQHSETVLQKRYDFPIANSTESLWPKPIQIDKCLSNNNSMEIEVKQEVLSDDDISAMEMDNEEPRMDIKVEPEEYSNYDCSPQIMETISITPIPEDEIMNNSHVNRHENDNYLEEHMKQEPLSDNESDVMLDLPLDCMLCTKTFHSVSGLKAHVIAQHSYLTIARKPEVTSPVYRCFTCRRTFCTHTDLIVHETCHGEYACYMCNSKFETFALLTKHRKRCRNNGDHVPRLKTLEDVKRPSPDPQHTETGDSVNTKLESNNVHSVKIVDSNIMDGKEAEVIRAKSQAADTFKDSTNTEVESQIIYYPQVEDSYSESQSQKSDLADVADSIDIESQLQKMHSAEAEDSPDIESQLQKMHSAEAEDSPDIKPQLQIMHSAEAEDSPDIESQLQKMHGAEAEDLPDIESQLQKMHSAESEDSPDIESQLQKMHSAEDSPDIESRLQKMHSPEAVDSIVIIKTKSEKIEDSTDTGSQPRTNDHTVITYILGDNQCDTVLKSNRSNNPIIIDNKSIPEKNNPESELILKSEVIRIDHNPTNNSNSDSQSDNSNNSKTTNQIKDLNTQTPMNNTHIEISTESEDLNLTLDSSNNTYQNLMSSDPEINLKKGLLSDLSQWQSLNTNSTSPKLVSDSAAVTSNDFCDSIVSEYSNFVSDSVNVSERGHSVSKNSNLESVLVSTLPKTACANMSLEISKNSIENTPDLVAESDSTKIHLAIRSLKKKSLSNMNDEQIEKEGTPESNEDKILR